MHPHGASGAFQNKAQVNGGVPCVKTSALAEYFEEAWVKRTKMTVDVDVLYLVLGH